MASGANVGGNLNPNPGSITRTNCILPLKMGYEFSILWVIVRCYIMVMIIVTISEHLCVSGNVICTLYTLARLILTKTL